MTGSSCLGFLEELDRVVEQRARGMPEGSYTARLLRDPGLAARKLGEEAAEAMVEALVGTRERLVEEAADLLYHLMVLLRLRGASLCDVARALEARAGWRRG